VSLSIRACSTRSEREILTQFIAENDLKPVRLLNTHCHIDHVLGNDFVYRKWGLKPEFHKLDVPTLERGIQSSAMFGIPYDPSPEAGRFIVDGEEIAFGQTLLKHFLYPDMLPVILPFIAKKTPTLLPEMYYSTGVLVGLICPAAIRLIWLNLSKRRSTSCPATPRFVPDTELKLRSVGKKSVILL
jgi:hypothetical protein